MENVIEVIHLTKRYGQLCAVDDLSLAVGKGEIFGLLGHNGAGKSTTIECLLGTRRQDSGTIRVLGLDPARDRKALFERVGVQFQESRFQDKLQVGEACEVAASLYREPRDWRPLLERFELGRKLKVAVRDLSGGERQKLTLILALIPGPALLFLDELTTGLDPSARREVWDYLLALKADGVTIFLSSHFMDEVEYLCDRIALLKAGRVVARGTPKDLVAEHQVGNLEAVFLQYMKKEVAI